jgi:hypothetical protein
LEVWGDVPASSILHIFPLSDLQRVAADIPEVGSLLRLEQFTKDSKTQAVSRRFQLENAELNCEIVKTMAKIAQMFGLGGKNVGRAHIAEFVAVRYTASGL